MVYYTGRVCLYNLDKYSFKSFALTLQGGAIMGKDIVTELGVIDISKDVIANLAGLATMECVGVVGVVSTRAFTDGLGELLGKESLSKGVEVELEDDNSLIIRVHVVLAYGIPVPVIANNIIENVKYIVERHTNLRVDKVDVRVDGIRVIK